MEPQLVASPCGRLEQNLGCWIIWMALTAIKSTLENQEASVSHLAGPHIRVLGCGHLDFVPFWPHVISWADMEGNKWIFSENMIKTKIMKYVTTNQCQVILIHLSPGEALSDSLSSKLAKRDAQEATGGKIQAVREPELVS
ncbi:hypothetical protein E2C01_010507 [Portunus trituberculatus]|uniref:Uncharacterized protein n=1 Tax=Portunus trituberculatus TaxID=210409 RepID=A0A5B7D8U5_PORTR|nr:hypothetical protein [Portunus trituberculatus]